MTCIEILQLMIDSNLDTKAKTTSLINKSNIYIYIYIEDKLVFSNKIRTNKQMTRKSSNTYNRSLRVVFRNNVK